MRSFFDLSSDRHGLRILMLTVYQLLKAFLYICLIFNLFHGPCDTSDYGSVTLKTNGTDLVDVAYKISFISMIYELIVAAIGAVLIAFCLRRYRKHQPQRCNILMYDETRIREMERHIRPIYILDIAFVILFAPIANIYMFLRAGVDCPAAYVTIGVRIAFYCSALALPTIYSYLRVRDDRPQAGALGTLGFTLLALASKLITCSSCIATYVSVASHEKMDLRHLYFAFSIVIGLSALVTYYNTLVKLIHIGADKLDRWKLIHEILGHAIFAVDTLANVALIVMNAHIFKNTTSPAAESSAEKSLVITVVSTAISLKHFLTSEFCRHGPLYKFVFFKCKQVRRKRLEINMDERERMLKATAA